MARSHGAATRLLGAFETVYGTAPASGWVRLPFGSSSLGAAQPLIENDLLGFGRDPLEPGRDVVRLDGDVTVPIDLRGIGWWLTLLLGPATVTGDGPYTHEWASGADTLPSATLEVGHERVPRYFRNSGVRANSLQIQIGRSGFAQASFGLLGQGESDHPGSIEANPDAWPIARFNQFQASIRSASQPLANITAAEMRFANGMEAVPTIRDDALVEDVEPGLCSGGGGITARFASMALLDQATAGTPIDLVYRYRIGATQSLEFAFAAAYLPRPKVPIAGPGGIEAVFEWQGAQVPGATPMMTATLINDVDLYLAED